MNLRTLNVLAAGMSLIGSSAMAQTPTPPYRGLYVIIDPFNVKSGVCSDAVDAPTWLTPNCGTQNGTNPIYSLFTSGIVTGVFLHMSWGDYVSDAQNNNHALMNATLGYIANIVKTPAKINLTIGLAAGNTTPCDTYIPKYGPVVILDPNANQPSGYSCLVIPRIWSGFNPYTTNFNAAVKYIHANLGGASITALKLSGINTSTLETHISGSPASPQQGLSLSGSCTSVSGSTMSYPCTDEDAADHELKQIMEPDGTTLPGYSPNGVESTWNAIAQNDISLSSGLGITPIYEIDALDANVFPPIIAANSTSTPPSFNCGPGAGACVVDQTQGAYTVDGSYFMRILVNDLYSQDGFTTNPSAPSPQFAAVQTDGLQDAGYNNNPNPTQSSFVCYAHNHNGTIIGFQMLTKEPGTDTINYYGALMQGTTYGAEYEELWPSHLAEYVNAQSQAASKLYTIEQALLSPTGTGCSP